MISIIVPTYNSEKTIQRCLDSIIVQEYQKWEVLIIDACSIDRTIEIASSYQDKRIYIYSESDRGIYDAMNKGIKRANGEWLYFLGSDDYLFDSKVLVDIVKEFLDQYKVIYGDVYAPQLSNEYRGEWKMEYLNYNRCHQAIFYQRDFFKRYGLYNLKYPLYADYDVNLKWFLNENINSKYVDRLIAKYSAGGVSSTGEDKEFWKNYEWNIIKRGFEKLDNNQRKLYLQQATNVARINKLWLRYVLLRIVKVIYNKCRN